MTRARMVAEVLAWSFVVEEHDGRSRPVYAWRPLSQPHDAVAAVLTVELMGGRRW